MFVFKSELNKSFILRFNKMHIKICLKNVFFFQQYKCNNAKFWHKKMREIDFKIAKNLEN